MRLRNRLWNPEHEIKRKGKAKETAFNDPLCCDCVYKGRCTKGACYWMKHINGNAQLKEPLFNDMAGSEEFIFKDYKVSLSEMIEDHEERLEYIINIKDTKKRAIAAMLSANITKKDIATLFKMSRRQIIRISKQ